MAELETKTKPNWVVKVFIFVGILVVAVPPVIIAAVWIGLKAHLKDDCRMLLARNLGVECRVYAAKHDGRFPTKWSDLEWADMDEITNMTRVFVCPTVGHGVGDWKLVDFWSDYRLIPGRTTNDSPDTVLAIEPLSNHKSGANVLFVDGSSQWWPAERILRESATSEAVPK